MRTLLQIKVLLLAIVLLPITLLSQETIGLWGMTYRGGQSDVGVIFKTDANGGNIEVPYDFFKTDGYEPVYNEVIQASDGKFYGMAPYTGPYLYGEYFDNDSKDGVLYQYDPITGAYETKFKFGINDFGAYDSSNGIIPFGSLVEVNTKLYGTTNGGGDYNDGVIFEYDYTTETFTKLYDFNDDIQEGRIPQSKLMQASNGKLYGMTFRGGANNFGVVFEFDLETNTYTKKIDFDGNTLNMGKNPHGSLFEASNGKLYGMTEAGGTYDKGVLFEYDFVNNTLTNLFNFGATTTSGAYPEGTVIEGPNNSLELFGVTLEGGLYDYGILFKYDLINDTFTTLINFGDSNNLGYTPGPNLTLASNNKLYGVTAYGGGGDIGSLFEYNPANDESSMLYSFNINSGYYPSVGLFQGTDGKLYSVTSRTFYGQVDARNGMFYSFDITNNTYNPIFKFNSSVGGAGPDGSLIYSETQQKFYGLTYRGGINDTGAIFEFNPATNAYTKLYDFDEILGTDSEFGVLPKASLLEATNGKLYGTTYRGGATNYGVFFEFDLSTNTFTKKHDFGETLGGSTLGDLMQASNNKIYGMTSSGGEGLFNGEISVSVGTIFEYDISTNNYTKLYDFDIENGGSPNGGLIEATNGKFYGMTRLGGLSGSGSGVVFEFDLVNGINILYEFEQNGINGEQPYGNLIQFDENTLYGLTSEGGTNDEGVIFKLDIQTNTFTKIFDFNGTATGAVPLGSLTELNNKLYGVTSEGGTYGYGTVFEFDPQTLTFTKTIDFNSQNGRLPTNLTLVALDTSTLGISDNTNRLEVWTYPNPASNTIYIKAPYTVNSLTLYDVLGNLVLYSKDANQLNVNQIKEGIYFLKINTNKQTITKKVIIKK
ncbi:MAG: T9SS type A sorting domain-containing protein [Mangrovimonas sp.]|nr:T9SS type A sorting domain-containing protein [Mangrovimonas sp.]MCB0432649.1 T9SS type A sorting domain-containing protein [Mangrovimonas sp.]MCB0434665.1 T9SS type A sorting domain-containing protein [Mangrovimonas sp.]